MGPGGVCDDGAQGTGGGAINLLLLPIPEPAEAAR